MIHRLWKWFDCVAKSARNDTPTFNKKEADNCKHHVCPTFAWHVYRQTGPNWTEWFASSSALVMTKAAGAEPEWYGT